LCGKELDLFNEKHDAIAQLTDSDIGSITHASPQQSLVLYWPRSPVGAGFFLAFNQRVVRLNHMARVAVVIDGFNFFHSLLEKAPGSKHDNSHYRWIDYTKLAKCFITTKDSIERIVYCTAYPIWSDQKRTKHELFVNVQKKLNVDILLGQFRKKRKKCRHCNKSIDTHEEKQTDVNVAVSLFQMAMEDVFDTALLITGDSDICPAIRAVRKNFPNKSVEVVIPINRQAEELKSITNKHHKIKEQHLLRSLLPVEIDLGRGVVARCPTGWMPPHASQATSTQQNSSIP
jgi:uncharacterized LabA/DUF88 family protein